MFRHAWSALLLTTALPGSCLSKETSNHIFISTIPRSRFCAVVPAQKQVQSQLLVTIQGSLLTVLSSSQPRPGLLLSSTNPLVLKNCQKSWPHILRLDRPTTTATNPIRSNSLPNPTPAGANTLSPISATTSPAISPLIGRRKEVFGDSHSSRAPSRSSSVASTNRLRPSGNDQADTWSGASSTRSSSPISFMSSSTSTGSPRPPPPSFVGTTPSKKTALASANGSESWWGLKSERKRHLKKDDAVFKLIEKRFREGDCELLHSAGKSHSGLRLTSRPFALDVGCDEVIYKHFASLTEKLLAPMSRYLLTTNTSASPS